MNVNYSSTKANKSLVTPHLFAINVIFTHFFLWNAFKATRTFHRAKNIISLSFSIILFIILLYFHVSQIFFIFAHREIYDFIFTLFMSRHLAVIGYWVVCLIIFFPLNSNFLAKLNVKLIIKRKFYHFLACIIFIPGIYFLERETFQTICLIIIYLFIGVELIRNEKGIQDVGMIKSLNRFMKENIDARDDTKLIMTHIFLLIGVSSSLFYNFSSVSYYAIGVLVLGIGDSMCSIGGIMLGKTKIYPLNNRTLEGTISGLASTLIAFTLITKETFSFRVLLNFFFVFVYEGLTTQIDNLVLPLLANNIFLI